MKIEYGTFTDPRDKQEYRAFSLNGLVWLAEDLNYAASADDRFKNGSKHAVKEKRYSCLYRWDNAEKACPPGWRLPSNNEWFELKEAIEKDKTLRKYFTADGGGWWFSSEECQNHEMNENKICMFSTSYGFIETLACGKEKSDPSDFRCVTNHSEGFAAIELPKITEICFAGGGGKQVILEIKKSDGSVKYSNFDFVKHFGKIEGLLEDIPEEDQKEDPKPKKRKKAA